MIEVATDGSSLGNPGDSAWAWFVTDNRWRSGFISKGTNNQAELMAIRSAAFIKQIITDTNADQCIIKQGGKSCHQLT